jgi:putative NADH-flavin reductase
VTGIERHPKPTEAKQGLTLRQGDATQPAALAPLLAGHDAVVSASRFQTSDATALIAAVTARSWVSMEDFAIALVDELEHPRHRRERFTAGY